MNVFENNDIEPDVRSFEETIKDFSGRICIGIMKNSNGMFNIHLDKDVLESPYYLEYITKVSEIIADFVKRETNRLDATKVKS